MGEGGTGGDLVAPEFASSVWHLVKEFSALLSDCRQVDTANGAPYGLPVYSAFTAAGAALTENPGSAIPDGSPGAGTPLVAYSLVQFGQAPTYGARAPLSMQLQTDAVDHGDSLSAALAEAIGRQVASAVGSAVYGAATVGQEVTLGTVTNANVAKLLGLIDPAVVPGARLYVHPTDWALLAADDATKLRNFPVPVVPTFGVTAFSTGSVSGPVLANLGASFVLRRVASLQVQVTNQVASGAGSADYLGHVVIANARYDVKAVGQTAAVVYSK